MKRPLICLELLLAGFCLALSAHAAPTRISSNSGEVRDLLYTMGSGSSATVYAATLGGGVFKSTTGGSTWTHQPGLPARYIHRLAVSPSSPVRIYAATESGLFRSADSGASWTLLSQDPTTAVAADPGNVASDTLLIGVHGVGIVRVDNANGSASFTRASSGLDSTDVVQIAYQSSQTAVAGLACNHQDVTPPYKEANYGGAFRTTSNGASWTSINTLGGASLSITVGGVPTDSKCVTSVAANSTTILVGLLDPLYNQGYVQRSVIMGAWSMPTAGNPNTGDLFGVTSVRIDKNSPTTFWAGSAQVGVWRTTNGTSWVQEVNNTNDPDMFTGINAVETVSGGSPYPVLAAPRGLGVFSSTSTTTTTGWNLTTGLTADRVRSLANHATAHPGIYYMALEKGSVMKSIDEGVSWLPIINGLQIVYTFTTQDFIRNAQTIAAHPTDPSIVALGVRAAGLYTLTGGTTWTRVGAGASGSFTAPVDHKPQGLVIGSDGTTYYSLFDAGAATPGGLFRGSSPTTLVSTGKPIFEADPGLGVAPGAYRVVLSPNAASKVYLLMYDSEPYRSVDGINFGRAGVNHTGFMRAAFWDIAERPGVPNTVVGSTNKGIFRSSDGGATFSRISVTGLTDLNLSSIAYSSDGRLFGGNYAGGFFCSKDDGTTWQAVALGSLPPVPVREVRFLNNQIHWLTDGGGIYKSTPATDCP